VPQFNGVIVARFKF